MDYKSAQKALPDELLRKLKNLREYIQNMGSLAVGFSGGADSSFLMAVARDSLGEKAIAVTAAVQSMPARELSEARNFCIKRGIKHIICKVNQLQIEEYRNNNPDRCYFCKYNIFSKIKEIAQKNGIEYVAEGSNMDDINDYRPGLRAVEELLVKSPLREAKLYKSEIRQISKTIGLPTWNKPACACLASRFEYGEEITEQKLRMIEQAEQFLIDNGFLEERVRMHGRIARIEVSPKDISRLASEKIREAVYKELKKIGFTFVTLDLKGYRTGSMNDSLENL